jgi:hypothetical protein
VDVSTGISKASRIGMLADGLRDAGSAWKTRVHMEIWPIFNSKQVARVGPDVRAYLHNLTETRELLAPGAGFDDALAAIRELEDFASTDAPTSRRSLRQLGELSITTSDRLEASLVGTADDAAGLAAARSELFARLGDDAADVTAAEAAALLPFMPPGIAGAEAQAYLGLASPAHASEFISTIQKAARGEATTADRERLALIELIGRGTPEADEKLRSIALKIFETEPKDLKAPAWNRLATMLDLDASGRVLDGPRTQRGSARDLQDLATVVARRVQYTGEVRTGSVTRKYFEQWRQVLGAHVGVDGAPLVAHGRSPNVERMFQLKPPEAKQLVADLGRVGASSFKDIETALTYVDERFELLAQGRPQLASTIADSRKLITENLERLKGLRSDGYSRHPEYSQLGRIRSNIELVEQIVGAEEAAAIEAAEAARTAAAGATPVPPAGEGSLTW